MAKKNVVILAVNKQSCGGQFIARYLDKIRCQNHVKLKNIDVAP